MSVLARALVAVSATLALCQASFTIRPRHQAPNFKAKAVLHDQFIDVRSCKLIA